MSRTNQLRRHERSITKAVFALSLISLIVLGSTIAVATFLSRTPRNQRQTQGWERTPEIRIIMDSTADWSRIMFNDLFGTSDNGLRIVQIHQHGWLLGNDSDDRVDTGRLTFIDIIYNSTIVKTGDIIGFFKGNNDFRHTKMYADAIFEINMNMRQVFVFIMLAGAGTTTFEFINKETGSIIWQDAETGNSYTQYVRRWIPSGSFFVKQAIDAVLIVLMVTGAGIVIVALNLLPLWRKPEAPPVTDGEGL